MTSSEIIKKYPNLFGAPPFDLHKTLIGFGFECGIGWYPIIEEALAKINEVVERDNLEGFRITQIKEKFGSLNIYTNYGTNEIYNIIDNASSKTHTVCEECGSTEGKFRRDGWLCVKCDSCYGG